MSNDALKFERRVDRVVALLRGHGGFILITVSALIAGFGAIPGAWWLAIVAIVPAVSGLILHLRLKPSYSELANREAVAQQKAADTSVALQDALDSILRRIAAFCEVNATHQRISIYCHVDVEFVLLARESSSTVFEARGRSVYPHEQGVIGEAWNLGETYRSRWPEDRKEWEELQCSSYDIEPEVVRGLRMHSRSIAAMRLTHDHSHVGVIVMESTEPQGVRRRHLTKARESMLLQSVCEILVSAQPHFPAVAELAKQKIAKQFTD